MGTAGTARGNEPRSRRCPDVKSLNSDKRTSVTVLIPLFSFSITTHSVHPLPRPPCFRQFLYLCCFLDCIETMLQPEAQRNTVKKWGSRKTTSRKMNDAVAASAESFDNCQSSSPNYGPGANSLFDPPDSKLRLFYLLKNASLRFKAFRFCCNNALSRL